MAQRLQFTMFSRILHWTMAVMILATLFIGVGMVASLSDYHWLVSVHKPMGILILVLVAIRLVNRLLNPAPSLPDDMPAWQRFVAHTSHVVLYALMFALPLVGWGMLSAARYPIILYGPLQLPPILPHDAVVYAVLRSAHTVLALLLFATFIAHFSANGSSTPFGFQQTASYRSESATCSKGQSVVRPITCADPLRASPIRLEAGRNRVG